MFDFLLMTGNLAFSYALLVLVALLVLEIIGMLLGSSVVGFGDGDFDIDMDFDANSLEMSSVESWLSWLGVGRIPLLALIGVICFFFGLIGIAINNVVFSMIGQLLPMLVSIPVSLALSLPLVSGTSRLIGKYLPRDETNSITIDKLVGQVGIITNGNASINTVAFARVYDNYGVQHNVRVMGYSEVLIPERSQIRLDSYNDQGYFLVTTI